MAISGKRKKLLKLTGPVLLIFFLVKIVDLNTVIGLLADIRPGMIFLAWFCFLY